MKQLDPRIFVTAAVCAFCSLAHADTLTDNYGPGFVNYLTGATSQVAVPGFNPSLGTLTGISFTYSASAVLLEGDSISATIKVFDPDGTQLGTVSFPHMGDRSQDLVSGTFSVPSADFAAFESLTPVDLSLTPFSACRGPANNTPSGCNGFSGNISGQVTYTYSELMGNPSGQAPSPASATPEPGSVALLGMGLIGLSVCCHRLSRSRIAGTTTPESSR